MALPGSGAISLSAIQAEFGGTNPISMSEYYGAGGVPSSGTLRLSDFYGVAAAEFKTVLYAGNSSTQTITGFGFDPDIVIFKRRGGTGSNYVIDSVRGNYKGLYTDGLQAAENTNSSAYPALVSGGFYLPGSSLTFNTTGNNYVAWGWKLGGSPVNNSDGTLSSVVLANTNLGFSIVSYVGAGNFGDTVGHGLGSVPEIVITKSRNSGGNWVAVLTGTSNLSGLVGTTETLASGEYAYGYLNANNAITTSGFNFYSSNSSTFFTFIQRTLGESYISYCFTSVAGASKIGAYTGNGNSTTGVTVTTGFEPSFLLIKRANSTSDWLVLDNVRDTSNPRSVALFLDLNIAEINSSTYNVDFNSNGFTAKGTSGNINANGSSYLYIAFA